VPPSRPRPRFGTVESIDVWSVAKVSFPFYVVIVALVIGAGLLLWAFLVGSGTTESFEEFVIDAGYSDFEFLPDQMFEAGVKGGLIFVVVGTFANVVVAILFNILSSMVGGLRLATVERPPRRRPHEEPPRP
jgi:hypothetical protein